MFGQRVFALNIDAYNGQPGQPGQPASYLTEETSSLKIGVSNNYVTSNDTFTTTAKTSSLIWQAIPLMVNR